jgi:hypothetical protein
VVTRKTLIGLAAALLLVAAACSSDDRPTFDDAVEEGESTATTAAGDDSSAASDTTEETTADATPEVTPPPLVKMDPPPVPDASIPPQPTAEDALAVYAGLQLEAAFVGDCANKPDGDTSPTLCYVTDNVTWSVGPSDTEPWYLIVVTQIEGGWVVTEANLWGPPPPAADPGTGEGA